MPKKKIRISPLQGPGRPSSFYLSTYRGRGHRGVTNGNFLTAYTPKRWRSALFHGVISFLIILIHYHQARSQPARWGGSELGWVEHQAHPPLGHCPRDVINLKNAPTLGHSQAPPLGHCPCDVIHIFQGWNKIAKGWNKIAEGWNKIAKGWNKIAEGWNKIAKGWNKIAERWNKIAKGWNKIAKGWNKIFGMGNWGGSYDPPDPPPGYGPDHADMKEANRIGKTRPACNTLTLSRF